MSRADVLDAVLVLGDEVLPALGRELRDAVEPARVELGALVVLEEVLARHAVAFGEPHQPALVADEPLVDVVELLDQRIDARLVEPQRLHLGDDLFLELLVLALLRGRERVALAAGSRCPGPAAGAAACRSSAIVVEGLEHLRLELGLDRGERQRILHVVVVEVGFAGGAPRLASPSSPSARRGRLRLERRWRRAAPTAARGRCGDCGRRARHRRRRRPVAVGAERPGAAGIALASGPA